MASLEQLQNELTQFHAQRARERAVERIRASVLSMHASEDLLQVVLTMYRQFAELGIEVPGCGFFFVDEERQCILWYTALNNPRQWGIGWTNPDIVEVDTTTIVNAIEVPIEEDWDEDLNAWRTGNIWSVTRTKEEDVEVMQPFQETMGFDRNLPYFGASGWTTTNFPFSHGWVGLRHRATDPENLTWVAEMTEALSLGYLRNLDFQRLEEQNHALEEALQKLKETQEQLIMQEKMASLGGLVAGVAHEINTPIGVGLTATTALNQLALEIRRDFERGQMQDSQLADFLKIFGEYNTILIKNLRRAGDLVQSFKKVAVNLSTEARQAFDLRTALDEMLLSISPQLRQTRHTIEVKGETGLVIDSYPGEFTQVVTNLVMNSLIHAYNEGDKGNMCFEVARSDKGYSITYSDNGKGIDPQIQERIFDPFFTTRRGAGGTGLGLHIVYNTVVQKLGGTIRCESELGQGTRLYIELPASSPD